MQIRHILIKDHRTQFWKRAIQGPFHQSLVGIGPVVSEEKIKMWNVDGRTKSDDNSSPGLKWAKKGCTGLAAASDKGYQLLVHGLWFSPGTPASSTTETGRHDIAEILLKVALNTKNHQSSSVISWRSVVFKYLEKTTDLTNFIT
jgi:hypothetical protein